jgi:hypothetical protein
MTAAGVWPGAIRCISVIYPKSHGETRAAVEVMAPTLPRCGRAMRG